MSDQEITAYDLRLIPQENDPPPDERFIARRSRGAVDMLLLRAGISRPGQWWIMEGDSATHNLYVQVTGSPTRTGSANRLVQQGFTVEALQRGRRLWVRVTPTEEPNA